MFKGYLFSALALFALMTPISTSPLTNGRSLDLNVKDNVGLDANWDVDNDQSSTNPSPLERRDPKHFTFFRRRFYTQSCGPVGHNCNDGGNDVVRIHTDCNGGGCNGDIMRSWEYNENLCNKEFKVCGTEYVMKYTGKTGSCMSNQYFARKGENNGKVYANLMKKGKKVGTCHIYSTDFKARSCSAFGTSDFWSMVRCTFS
jgi:hypothetical protein